MGSRRGSGAAGQQGGKDTERTKRGKVRGAPRAPLATHEIESRSFQIREAALPGVIPRYEIPGWRERYGVVAGITGRGFDLGLWSKAPVGEVMSRWLSFRREMHEFPAVVLGNQVHGVEVKSLDTGQGWIHIEGIDGWITPAPGVLLTVTIADCVPVYLVAPRGIALLHAGWRGTAGGILSRGVGRLAQELGCSVPEIVMHCGVGICGDCYEVGSEVMTGCGLPAAGHGPWHIDLRERLVAQGSALGISVITSSPWCSAHDRSHFYSHRASRGTDGRMVAYIGMAGPQGK